MRGANEVIAPLLGLPHLRVSDLLPTTATTGWTTCSGGRRYWCASRTDARSSGSMTYPAGDRRWIEGAHPARVLLHQVDPSVGMIVADVDTVATWLRDVRLSSVDEGRASETRGPALPA